MKHLRHFIKQIERTGLGDLTLPIKYQNRAGRTFIDTTIRNVPSQEQALRTLYDRYGMAVALHLLMRPQLSKDEIYDLRFIGEYVDTFESWEECIATFVLAGCGRVSKRRLRRQYRIIELLGAVYVFRRPQRMTSKGW